MSLPVMPVRTAQDATLNFDRLRKDLDKAEARLVSLPTKMASGEATLEYTAKSRASAVLKVVTGLTAVSSVTVSGVGKGELGVGVKVEGGEIALQAWFEKEELALGTKVKAFWIAIGT